MDREYRDNVDHVAEDSLLRVRELLEREQLDEAIDLIEALLPPDQADVFEELPPDQQEALLPYIDTEDAADILEELEDEDAAQLAGRIDADALATIINEMAPDEAADLLGDLDPSLSIATLEQMQDPDEVRPLLLHPDETAGGLMTSEYLVFRQNMRAGQVLPTLRDWTPKGLESPNLFIVDRDDHLVGIVSLFRVLRADAEQRLADLMDRDVISVNMGDDQETAARLMVRYDLVALPVVDDEQHLMGIITVDDLVDVLEDEATEDIQRIAATEPLAQPYLDASIPSMVWKRLGWLLLLFVTGTLTSTVMSLYQGLLEEAVILTVFIPLLIGTGGNAGSQTTATVIRALAVGDIDLGDALSVLWREGRTALLLGAMLAIVAFVVANIWGANRSVAVVVAISILGIVLWAETVGALLPLLAAKLKMDPALVSGPLMSTLVDATGLLIYFTIARLILGT